ncbi:MAG: S8 family serine peptidase [Planctomycetota bacterium]|nr:MAG: S8 family serine peptidase [Planctomycetota bacterium]
MRKILHGRDSKTGVFKHVGTGFRCSARVFIVACLASALANLTANGASVINLSDPVVREQTVARLAAESRRTKATAWQMAQSQGWVPKQLTEDRIFELMAIRGGRIYFYRTCNVNAAISVGADLIRNTPPYDLNGAGLTVGIWDGGAARATHQELSGRVTVLDGASYHNHSTHVAGTIGAAGVIASALGMAPSVLTDCYEWTDDLAEMTSRAMSYPNEPGKIQASNHSYSYICGWETGDFSGSYGSHWFGTYQKKDWRESDYFGQYDSEVAQWDELCYNAPYYLPFKAAGNDRSGANNNAPADGTRFYYYKVRGVNIQWWSKIYDSSSDPCDDGWDNGGFDTIPLIGVAKNIMTVGAVHDAVSGGMRDPVQGAMADFSGWGPTDDGRIKPDIVTNGTSVYSPIADSDSSYDSWSGTSMATPGAVGAATLLVEYYGDLFPPQAMRSSTLKALIIHTADDLGTSGPDYKFGWGLINAQAAAEQITDHYDAPDANRIVEGILDDANTLAAYTFESGTGAPIKATLCWTDPPAAAIEELDDPTPRLLNDLDLRLIDPNGSTTFYPFVLNPASPNDPAATGDNTLDNVEQVIVSSPAVPGNYTAEVTYKGTLTNGQQYYSLILSASSLTDFNGDRSIDLNDLNILSNNWLKNAPSIDIAPAGGDGIINFLDFEIFAQSLN